MQKKKSFHFLVRLGPVREWETWILPLPTPVSLFEEPWYFPGMDLT